LKFYYKKKKNATQTSKKICDVYGHDAVSVCIAQAGSSVFNLEILMSKMHLALVDQSWKVDEIMEKVEQDSHINSHDIGKELNIDDKTVLNHLEKVEYKKTRCLGATWFNSKKNVMDRIFICKSLLKRNKIAQFLASLNRFQMKQVSSVITVRNSLK